jgi:glycosyltransferase involved in cell wall biosynthesis
MKRFIAVQTGARRNYAVPTILAKAGMLEALYTDMCTDAGICAMLDRFCPQFLRKGQLNNLLNRRVPSDVEGKVSTFDLSYLRYLARKKLSRSDLIKQNEAVEHFNNEFSCAMARKGLSNATHIFSMFGEGTNFLKFAKERDLKIITEIYISPIAHRIIQAERNIYPEIETPFTNTFLEKYEVYSSEVCKLTDLFISPSRFVVKGLQELGVNEDRCCVIPYAVDEIWFDRATQPTKGRILFAGTAELRKGIHILGMAAQKLSHCEYEFRVAGTFSDKVSKHKLTQHLTFLGRVPRSEIQHEFISADIFVLPSLAEGSAEVIYQALATGLPVITTEGSGSVVRDGIEGFIIPARNADVLAEKIQELVENRALRHRMAIAAKERAKNYTLERYTERLLSSINSF